MIYNIDDEINVNIENNENDSTMVEESPKIEKVSLKDISQAKDDDLVARVMEQILKIK